jgi:ferritin-like metal-binding protein YciE
MTTATKKPAVKAVKKTAVNTATSAKEDSALQELFLDELKDIYWAEQHLAKALPKMAKAATSPDLKAAFEKHLGETNGQIQRLDKAFASIGEKAKAVKCTEVRDVALISAAQKVEHYEIASYGTMKTLAAVLGYKEAAELLSATLEEEKACDLSLTGLAEGHINVDASTEKK